MSDNDDHDSNDHVSDGEDVPNLEEQIITPVVFALNGKSKINSDVTTEGISDYEIHNNKLSKNKIKMCNMCNKYYSADMIVNYMEDDQCYHCLFWLNHNIESRKQVDGTIGLEIADYVLKCKDAHIIEKCTRLTDKGGCFLCEYLLEIPITDIKNEFKLGFKKEIPTTLIDNDDEYNLEKLDNTPTKKMVVRI